MIRTLTAASVLILLAGCASSATTAAHTATDRSSAGAAPVSAEQICGAAFAGGTLLGWTKTYVGDLRAYQYGGPVARVPLRSSFAGQPPTTRGAWCLVRRGPASASLWGVVPGLRPVRAMTVTGPGEDRFRGELRRAPVVP